MTRRTSLWLIVGVIALLGAGLFLARDYLPTQLFQSSLIDNPQDYPEYNEEAYLMAFPDVADAVANGDISSGFEHYINGGKAAGRTERYEYKASVQYVNGEYNEEAYLMAFPDIKAAVDAANASGTYTTGFDHYKGGGIRAGRLERNEYKATRQLVTGEYNEEAYLMAFPDIKAAIDAARADGMDVTGFDHYKGGGIKAGRLERNEYKATLQLVTGEYNEQAYLMAFPDIKAAIDAARANGMDVDGFDHYKGGGIKAGRLERIDYKATRQLVLGEYNEEAYLLAFADIKAALDAGLLTSGFQHYKAGGYKAGRLERIDYKATVQLLNGEYNEQAYLNAFGDIRAALDAGLITSGFQHYRDGGYKAGRLQRQAYIDALQALKEENKEVVTLVPTFEIHNSEDEVRSSFISGDLMTFHMQIENTSGLDEVLPQYKSSIYSISIKNEAGQEFWDPIYEISGSITEDRPSITILALGTYTAQMRLFNKELEPGTYTVTATIDAFESTAPEKFSTQTFEQIITINAPEVREGVINAELSITDEAGIPKTAFDPNEEMYFSLNFSSLSGSEEVFEMPSNKGLEVHISSNGNELWYNNADIFFDGTSHTYTIPASEYTSPFEQEHTTISNAGEYTITASFDPYEPSLFNTTTFTRTITITDNTAELVEAESLKFAIKTTDTNGIERSTFAPGESVRIHASLENLNNVRASYDTDRIYDYFILLVKEGQVLPALSGSVGNDYRNELGHRLYIDPLSTLEFRPYTSTKWLSEGDYTLSITIFPREEDKAKYTATTLSQNITIDAQVQTPKINGTFTVTDQNGVPKDIFTDSEDMYFHLTFKSVSGEEETFTVPKSNEFGVQITNKETNSIVWNMNAETSSDETVTTYTIPADSLIQLVNDASKAYAPSAQGTFTVTATVNPFVPGKFGQTTFEKEITIVGSNQLNYQVAYSSTLPSTEQEVLVATVANKTDTLLALPEILKFGVGGSLSEPTGGYVRNFHLRVLNPQTNTYKDISQEPNTTAYTGWLSNCTYSYGRVQIGTRCDTNTITFKLPQEILELNEARVLTLYGDTSNIRRWSTTETSGVRYCLEGVTVSGDRSCTNTIVEPALEVNFTTTDEEGQPTTEFGKNDIVYFHMNVQNTSSDPVTFTIPYKDDYSVSVEKTDAPEGWETLAYNISIDYGTLEERNRKITIPGNGTLLLATRYNDSHQYLPGAYTATSVFTPTEIWQFIKDQGYSVKHSASFTIIDDTDPSTLTSTSSAFKYDGLSLKISSELPFERTPSTEENIATVELTNTTTAAVTLDELTVKVDGSFLYTNAGYVRNLSLYNGTTKLAVGTNPGGIGNCATTVVGYYYKHCPYNTLTFDLRGRSLAADSTLVLQMKGDTSNIQSSHAVRDVTASYKIVSVNDVKIYENIPTATYTYIATNTPTSNGPNVVTDYPAFYTRMSNFLGSPSEEQALQYVEVRNLSTESATINAVTFRFKNSTFQNANGGYLQNFKMKESNFSTYEDNWVNSDLNSAECDNKYGYISKDPLVNCNFDSITFTLPTKTFQPGEVREYRLYADTLHATEWATDNNPNLEMCLSDFGGNEINPGGWESLVCAENIFYYPKNVISENGIEVNIIDGQKWADINWNTLPAFKFEVKNNNSTSYTLNALAIQLEDMFPHNRSGYIGDFTLIDENGTEYAPKDLRPDDCNGRIGYLKDYLPKCENIPLVFELPGIAIAPGDSYALNLVIAARSGLSSSVNGTTNDRTVPMFGVESAYINEGATALTLPSTNTLPQYKEGTATKVTSAPSMRQALATMEVKGVYTTYNSGTVIEYPEAEIDGAIFFVKVYEHAPNGGFLNNRGGYVQNFYLEVKDKDNNLVASSIANVKPEPNKNCQYLFGEYVENISCTVNYDFVQFDFPTLTYDYNNPLTLTLYADTMHMRDFLTDDQTVELRVNGSAAARGSSQAVHVYTADDYAINFDEDAYRLAFQDIDDAINAGKLASALDHYLYQESLPDDQNENRLSNPMYIGTYQHLKGRHIYNEEAYLKAFPDVATVVGTNYTTGYQHFIPAGRRENRLARPEYIQAFRTAK